jgi:ribonuclease HI
MELKAVVEAIKLGVSLGYTNIDIYSDSAYVVNAVKFNWLKKWEHNGWKTVKDQSVKNKDLWMQISSLIRKYKGLNIIKIKGHAGHKYNVKADGLARREIERMKMQCI